MQMRQKNLFVIVIMPIIFEFNKYAVLSRARCLIHTYENHGRMGYWVGYNKKDLKNLYLLGKKTYAYKVKSRFIGRFYGKYVVNEEEYRKKKSDALELIDDSDEKPKKDDIIAKVSVMLKEQLGIPVNEHDNYFKKAGINTSRATIYRHRAENKRLPEEKVSNLSPTLY